MFTAKLPYSLLIEALHIAPEEVVTDLTSNQMPLTMDKLTTSIIKHTRNNSGMAEFREFNSEVQDSWIDFAEREKWTAPDNERKKSLFEFVKEVTKACIRWDNDEPLFKIEEVDLWQAISFACGEDLFVCASLADRTIKSGFLPIDFQWNYIIRSDFFRLNNLIAERKINENHAHLWGTASNVDISWIHLMNYPEGKDDYFRELLKKQESYSQAALSYLEYKQCDIYQLVKIAAIIRVWLYKTCVLSEMQSESAQNMVYSIREAMDTDFVRNFPDATADIEVFRTNNTYRLGGYSVDYAIDNRTLKRDYRNIGISGERHLYYHCLNAILRYDNKNYQSDDVQLLFYVYLLIKHRFDQIFIQQNKRTGFNNFAEYQDRKDKLLENSLYTRLAANSAIQDNVEENNISKMEARITPKDSVDKLINSVSSIDRYAYRVPTDSFSEQIEQFDSPIDTGSNHFYVIHFIKGKQIRWNENSEAEGVMREADKRKGYRDQALVLSALRNSGSEIANRIKGIDAASSEVNFRPEVFGQVFRYLAGVSNDSNSLPYNTESLPRLRKTYHVGEDFYDISDGLRAIDEAVLFLELGHGDRIGHGVALGIDVEKWYQRHNTIALPIQNKLDNVAWILHRVREWNIPISTAYYEKLRTTFESYFNDLYGGSPIPDLLAYIESWKLRGDDPECFRDNSYNGRFLTAADDWERYRILDERMFRDLRNKYSVYQMIHRYHFDNELKKRAKKVDCFTAEPELVEVVKQLQIKMRKHIADKGVAVESCPSSNFLISNLDYFKETPTFQLFPLDETEEKKRLNVSINTDDQGVFYTSLQKEYAMLAGVLRKDYSDDRIIGWIERLIDNGKQQCFAP